MGIVLAVCGAGLYFLRSFKPALARDYDVFFAAIGLLCGGILFFQGWRLDPILQFGQFLLAGTTVFFAYESVRLRGVATDQARRSTYFDEEPEPSRVRPGGSQRAWDDDSYDQFDDLPRPRRRFSGAYSSETNDQEDFYSQRGSSRRAIPEEAESRRLSKNDDSWDQSKRSARRMRRFDNQNEDVEKRSNFGERRNLRQEQRKGTRPISNQQTERRTRDPVDQAQGSASNSTYSLSKNSRTSGKSSIGRKTEDAAFYPSSSGVSRSTQKGANNFSSRTNKNVSSRSRDSSSSSSRPPRSSGSSSRISEPRSTRIRDNNSRFDD